MDPKGPNGLTIALVDLLRRAIGTLFVSLNNKTTFCVIKHKLELFGMPPAQAGFERLGENMITLAEYCSVDKTLVALLQSHMSCYELCSFECALF